VAETSPGRLKLAEYLPKHPLVNYDIINRVLTKKEIGKLIDTIYRHAGQKATVIFADKMMGLGFREACNAGISFGKDDMVIPDAKYKLVNQTQELVSDFEQQYADGRCLVKMYGQSGGCHDGRSGATKKTYQLNLYDGGFWRAWF